MLTGRENPFNSIIVQFIHTDIYVELVLPRIGVLLLFLLSTNCFTEASLITIDVILSIHNEIN